MGLGDSFIIWCIHDSRLRRKGRCWWAATPEVGLKSCRVGLLHDFTTRLCSPRLRCGTVSLYGRFNRSRGIQLQQRALSPRFPRTLIRTDSSQPRASACPERPPKVSTPAHAKTPAVACRFAVHGRSAPPPARRDSALPTPAVSTRRPILLPSGPSVVQQQTVSMMMVTHGVWLSWVRRVWNVVLLLAGDTHHSPETPQLPSPPVTSQTKACPFPQQQLLVPAISLAEPHVTRNSKSAHQLMQNTQAGMLIRGPGEHLSSGVSRWPSRTASVCRRDRAAFEF